MIKLEKDINIITAYLQAQSWILEGENISSFEVPGEGNMNFTLRITTKRRSFIIKQSRNYVEKYPQIAAPEDRTQREADFYNAISFHDELNDMTPEIIGTDEINHIIAMEDFGPCADYTYLYNAEDTIPDADLKQIMHFAARLHTSNKITEAAEAITNRDMRKLNHEHIFVYPFIDDNGLNLDEVLPGLSELAESYKKDEKLRMVVHDLGEKYLEDGDTLLHGDYFPGSWLKAEDGIKIIDPEFCFHGYPEFEIGVTIAHLMLSDQPVETIFNAFKYYTSEAPLDMELCKQSVGIEIMRRILGLAQLPLKIDLEKRAQLLETAREYIMN